MSYLFEIPDAKKIRVLIDTDAACEADDPYAIVQALLSPKLIVRGILAEHFRQPDSMQRSLQEIRTILSSMQLEVPVYAGNEDPLPEEGEAPLSDAARAIIREAHMEDPHPLFVLCQGAITNVAAALQHDPDIRDRMTVVWIGTHGEEMGTPPFREFNAGNDIKAANLILSSGVSLWLIPRQVYGTIRVTLAELQVRVRPCGAIGRHLFDQMARYNESPYAGWTAGESWSLGDSPAIAVAIDESCAQWKMIRAPHLLPDTASEPCETNPFIRLCTHIDSRFILEDLYAKLALHYPPDQQ